MQCCNYRDYTGPVITVYVRIDSMFYNILNKLLYTDEHVYTTIHELSSCTFKESIYKIDVANMNISNISFLEHFPNLEIVNLSYNSLTNLDNINKLTKLTELNVSYNLLEDISALQDCNNLTKLSVKHNPLTDIDSLKYLSNLQFLDVTDTAIKNIDVLDENKNLEYVHLPYFCKSKTLERKLKYDIYPDILISRIITNKPRLLNLYYLSSIISTSQ